MTLPTVGLRGPAFLLPALLAVPVAMVIVLIKPSLGLPLTLGTLALVIAFLSPLVGIYILVFSMLLGPEVLVGSIGKGATLGRGVTLRFDDFLIVLVGLGWLGHMAVSGGVGRFLRTPLNRPIMLYTAACVFTTLIGMLAGRVGAASGTFFLLKYYEYFFLYFMAVNIISSQKQVRSLLIAALVTCVLVSLYALSQIPGGARVSAPFEGQHGEPNTLGGYLVFIMAVVAGFLLTPGAVPKKLPLFVLLLLGGIALQATLSRSSFLAAVIVMLPVLELARRRDIVVFAALLIFLIVVLVIMPSSVSERMMYTFTQPEEAGQIHVGGLRLDTSTSDRIRSWEQGFEHFWRSPIWGTGITGGPFMDAMYPRVLAETGLLGFTAFLYLLWCVFRMGMTALTAARDPYNRGLALGFLLGFLGLIVHAVGANTFIIVRIMEPFWLFAALVMKSYLFGQAEATRRDELTEPELSPVPPGPPEPAVSALHSMPPSRTPR